MSFFWWGKKWKSMCSFFYNTHDLSRDYSYYLLPLKFLLPRTITLLSPEGSWHPQPLEQASKTGALFGTSI